jgi:hypothetical protein
MKSFHVGPILPKDMVLDRIYKVLVPTLFMHTIPSAVPANKFAWITNCMPLVPDTLELAESNCEPIAVTKTAAGKVVARRGKKIVPSSSRVTGSALKAQVNIQKHDWKKRSRRRSFAAATSLFTEKVDSSSWTDSSVKRCTRHMSKLMGISLKVCKTRAQLGENEKHQNLKLQKMKRLLLLLMYQPYNTLEGN